MSPLLNQIYKNIKLLPISYMGNEILDHTPVGAGSCLAGESENLTAAKTAISEAGVRLTVLKWEA